MKIQNGISLTAPKPEVQAAQTDQRLREAAQMYEGYFLDEMVKAMRSTIPEGEGGVVKKNMAEKIFSQQLDQKYVEGWTQKGGVGLADMIYEQINDRIQSASQKRSFFPKGALPIAPKAEPLGVPATDSIQMKAIEPGPQAKAEYRFEVPNPSGGLFEAQAPMSGTVLTSEDLGQGWNAVKLDHGQGLTSEVTFPGRMAPIAAGQAVMTGQRLGELDLTQAALAWKLDWNDNA